MFYRLCRLVACLALFFASGLPVVAYAQTAAPVTSQTTADSNTVELAVPIGAVKNVSGLPQYVSVVYRYMLGIVTLVAIIMVIYGGFQYLLGASMGQIGKGKSTIQDALAGMAILFFAYTILYLVNPKLTTLSLPPIQRIQTIGIAGDNAQGTSCAKDSDCGGGKCLRTSANGGICATGASGNLCQCEGNGCSVSDVDAGGPTNNGQRGRVDCQPGLRCQEITAGHFICNGGMGAACNLTSNQQAQGPSARSAALGAAAITAGTGLVPFAPLAAAAVGGAVAVGNTIAGAATGSDRAAVTWVLF
ncbi:hypothetical protein KBB27_04610, partial [Patescibacteria group bacterium]|nr:hypothetical protein [Patescibacteria group bacterium]